MDKRYYEGNLPPYLQKSLSEYKVSLAKVESGQKDYRFDLYYDGLRSSINVAENGRQISREQADYIRSKYL